MSIQKNLILGIICICIFLSCEQAVEKGNKVVLNFDGSSKTYILKQLDSFGALEKIDSIKTMEGKGSFENVISNWYLLYEEDNQTPIPIFMENNDLTISGEFLSHQNLTKEGSVAQTDHSTHLNQLKKEGESISRIIKRRIDATKAGDTLQAQFEMELLRKAKQKQKIFKDQLIDDYIMHHPKSVLSAFYLWTESYRRSSEDIQKLNRWQNHIELDSSPSMVYMTNLIASIQMIDIGRKAPDFTQQDIDGRAVKLSDIYSKHQYTLIDFWASWCGPCKAEYPYMIEAYQAFSDEGFTILGISLDSKKQQWLDAIEEEGLNWIHVSDLKGSQNQAALLYGVSGIPSNFLVDRNGIILAKELRKEKLHQTLASLTKEKTAQN